MEKRKEGVLKYTFDSIKRGVPIKVRKGLLGGLFLVAVGLGCFGAYEEYEWHYLSSQLKTTLRAAMNDSATPSDVATYRRDARLQVHTKRDGQVLEKFEKCIDLGKDANEIVDRQSREVAEQLRTISSKNTYVDKLFKFRSIYLRFGMAVPKSLDDKIKEGIADQQAQQNAELKTYEVNFKRAQDERANSAEFSKELRVDLGLPPIPKTK